MAVTHRETSIKELNQRKELDRRIDEAPDDIELTQQAVTEVADEIASDQGRLDTVEAAVLELADLLGDLG